MTHTINGNLQSSASPHSTIAPSSVTQTPQSWLVTSTSQAPPTPQSVLGKSQSLLDTPAPQTQGVTASPVIQPSQTALDTPTSTTYAGGSGASTAANQDGPSSEVSVEPAAISVIASKIPSTAERSSNGTPGQETDGSGVSAQPSARPDAVSSQGGQGTDIHTVEQGGIPVQHESSAPTIVLTVGASAFTLNSQSEFVIGSQTLSPGGPAVTAGTDVVSLASHGTAVVVNGQASSLASATSDDAPLSIQSADSLASFILSAIGGIAPSSSLTAAVIALGSSTYTRDSQSISILGSQTLAPGEAPVTVDETALSLALSATAVVVDGHRSALAPLGKVSGSSAPITIGSSIFTPGDGSAFVHGSQTLAPGAAAITVGGSLVSLAPSALAVIVNGRTSALQGLEAAATPAALFTIGSSTYTADSASEFVLGSQTMAPGSAAITVGSSVISLAPSATALVINGQTSALPVFASKPSPPVITVGTSVITENGASRFVIGSRTLIAGDAAITVGSQTLSLAPSASAVVIDGQTFALAPPDGSPSKPVLTIGSTLYTENSASQFVIGTQTLSPGGPPNTVGTQVVSLGAGASSVVIDGSTFPIAAPIATTSRDFVITLGGSTYKEGSASDFIIGSQTLSAAGPAITANGTTISLAPGGSAVIVNGQTSDLVPESTTVAPPTSTASSSAVSLRAPSSRYCWSAPVVLAMLFTRW